MDTAHKEQYEMFSGDYYPEPFDGFVVPCFLLLFALC